MNIIFGRENVEPLREKYTILELDTFKVQEETITAFCAVDGIPIMDMPKIHSMKSLHDNLLENYRNGNWNYCEQALEHLVGFWNHELDTFYENLKKRIEENKDRTLVDNWWVIDKQSQS